MSTARCVDARWRVLPAMSGRGSFATAPRSLGSFVDRVFPALAQQKNLRMEKPWIECEWRDRGNRYPINTLVPMINQHVAIGCADDGHDN